MATDRIEKLVCLAIFLALVVRFISTVQAIDCYKCTSIDGMLKECEDKFDRGMNTVHLIKRECVYGHFKGTHCFKLIGEKEDGTKITVRDCCDGDWGNHCGDIRYLQGDEEHRITGCLGSCDHDGCNRSECLSPNILTLLSLSAVVIFTFLTDTFWRIIRL
ncbi:hypothetical protein BsWGS_06557 [Bradybaena similaris]